MKALTVQQPWAWAILHGKTPENRTTMWAHRGPLAIHAGARLSQRGCEVLPELLEQAGQPELIAEYAALPLWFSAVVGVVQVVDAHPVLVERGEVACCSSPWAEASYVEHGGRTRREVIHYELSDPQPLPNPIPCSGSLGLWNLPPHVVFAIRSQGVETDG